MSVFTHIAIHCTAKYVAKVSPGVTALLCEGLLNRLQSVPHEGRESVGLTKRDLRSHWAKDPDLRLALLTALNEKQRVQTTFPQQARVFSTPEKQALQTFAGVFRDFYAPAAKTPFIMLAGKGAWEVSTHGGVFLSVGGYGKDAFGHNPEALQAVMGHPHVIANIMTPHWSQIELKHRVADELGLGSGQFDIQMLNSGSEAMELGLQYVERLIKERVGSGADQVATPQWVINLEGSFHGRTSRPAGLSNSTKAAYERTLTPRSSAYDVHSVPANDVAALERVYDQAREQGAHVAAVVMEMVQGEGDPGRAITAEFYQRARALTEQEDGLLLVDSVQSGWRTYGCLSPLSAPAFDGCQRPDIEVFSKALTGGIYPGSMLVLNARASRLYEVGTYGNTMTGNAKAAEMAIAVFNEMTPEVRANMHARSQQFMTAFEGLQTKYPALISGVQGTGLLLALKIADVTDEAGVTRTVVPVVGPNGLERQLRQQGLNIIHGGKDNYLRLTPNFKITEAQVVLVVQLLDRVFAEVAKRLHAPPGLDN